MKAVDEQMLALERGAEEILAEDELRDKRGTIGARQRDCWLIVLHHGLL